MHHPGGNFLFEFAPRKHVTLMFRAFLFYFVFRGWDIYTCGTDMYLRGTHDTGTHNKQETR